MAGAEFVALQRALAGRYSPEREQGPGGMGRLPRARRRAEPSSIAARAGTRQWAVTSILAHLGCGAINGDASFSADRVANLSPIGVVSPACVLARRRAAN